MAKISRMGAAPGPGAPVLAAAAVLLALSAVAPERARSFQGPLPVRNGFPLEFPSGDAGKGNGNGRLDKRVALLAEGSIGGRINVVANIGKVFPGDLHGLTTVRFDDYRYGGPAIEAMLSARSSLVAQVFVQDTPLSKGGLVFPVLLADPMLLTVGYRYLSGGYGFEFSLTENRRPSFAPDLMLNVTMKRNLGGR